MERNSTATTHQPRLYLVDEGNAYWIEDGELLTTAMKTSGEPDFAAQCGSIVWRAISTSEAERLRGIEQLLHQATALPPIDP